MQVAGFYASKLWRRAIGGQCPRREYFPAQDDFGDFRESLNGYRGVIPKQKQIGALAYFNRSNLMIQAERLRIRIRSSLNPSLIGLWSPKLPEPDVNFDVF